MQRAGGPLHRYGAGTSWRDGTTGRQAGGGAGGRNDGNSLPVARASLLGPSFIYIASSFQFFYELRGRNHLIGSILSFGEVHLVPALDPSPGRDAVDMGRGGLDNKETLGNRSRLYRIGHSRSGL